MWFKLLNFLAFQVAWSLTVISAAKGMPYLGVISTCLWVSLHLYFLQKNKVEESQLFIAALCMGFFFESTLIFFDIVSYPAEAQFMMPTPLWMIALWVNVALTLNHCLSWINKKLSLAVVLGMIFGPLAYNGGVRLGAIIFDPLYGSLAIGLMWAIAMPLLIIVNRFIHSQSVTHRSLDIEY